MGVHWGIQLLQAVILVSGLQSGGLGTDIWYVTMEQLFFVGS